MNFEIEIVEAYRLEPTSKNKKSKQFSVHAYIAMYDIDVRGITIQKKSNGWFILMPSKSNYDEEEGKRIYFPVIDFTNPKTKKEFLLQINEKFVEYIAGNPQLENDPVEGKPKKPGMSSSVAKEKLEKMSAERNKNPKYKGK